MSIRSMTIQDIDSILQLEKQLFTSQWKEEDFIYEIETNPFSYLYVLIKEEMIIGYAGLWISYEQAEITTIGIKKEYQGKGYASQLMDYLIELAKKKDCETISLEVRISNKKAIKLYEKYGFTYESIRKNYYQDNFEDAYLMVKEMEETKCQSF